METPFGQHTKVRRNNAFSNLNICSIAKNGSMKYLVTKRFIRNPGLLLSAIGLPIKLIKRDTIW